MKKFFVSIMCIILSVALLPVGVFAVADFENDYGNLALSYYFTESAFADINITDGGAYAYEASIGGKSSEDYSMVVRIGGDTSDTAKYDITKTGTGANAYVSLTTGNKNVSIQDGRLYEFDAYVQGDIKLMVQPMNDITKGFVTAEMCNGKWIHIAAWLPKPGDDGQKHIYIYANGVEIAHASCVSSSVGIYRMRLVYWLTANKPDAGGMIAIDNYSLTTGLNEYVPVYQPVAYTDDDISLKLNGYDTAEYYYGDFSASLSLDNPIKQNNPPLFLLAQYDEKGNLIECISGDLSSDKTSVDIECDIKRVKGTYMRAFILEKPDTLRPLNSDAITILPGNGDLPGQRIYYNESFDDADLSLTPVMKTGNTLVVSDGYARIERGSADSCYFNMNFSDTSDNVVIEADFRNGTSYDPLVSDANLFFMRDSTSSESNKERSCVKLSNGVVKDNNKSVTLNNSPGEWTRISLAVDVSDSCYDLYYNGVLQAENIVIKSGFTHLNVWRIFLTGGDSNTQGVLEIDNIRAYDGIVPRDITGYDAMEQSVFVNSKAIQSLNNKTALSPYINTLYFNNEKINTRTPCIVSGDEALVCADTFAKLFGVVPEVSGDKVICGDAVFTVGSEYMQYGGKSIELQAAPVKNGDGVMIPARAYGINVVGDNFCDDGHGLFVVGTDDISNKDFADANKYMFNSRYSRRDIGEKLLANLEGDITKHPRVMATEDDFNRIREDINTDANMKKWYNTIISGANSIVSRSEVFPGYDVSSGRLTSQANKAYTEMLQLGMAYQITGNTKYSSRAIEIMKIVCSYPDWYPDHALGTGELAMAVAVGFDWCYDEISDTDKEYIMQRSEQLGLEVARDLYYDKADYGNQFWRTTETNWGSVVNAGIINLAFSIAEMDIDYTMDVAYNSLRSLEYPLYYIAPDGAWHEGPSYWNYFFRYLSYAFAGYESAIGEPHNGLYHKGMDGMVRFQPYFTDPKGKYNNFNDADIGSTESEARLYVASRRNMPEIMNHCVDFVNSGKINMSKQFFVFALLWYDKDMISDTDDFIETLPPDGYFRDTEFVSMRQDWISDDALWFSATGGSSASSHSQLDSGSFVLTLDGVRWATDLGTESGYYSRTGGNSATNAGYTNHHYYRRKAEGHNMVVINPDENLEIDKNAFAKFEQPVGNRNMAYTSIDLTSSYAGKADSYTRGYMLSDGRRSLTVRDEIDLSSDDSVLYWFMHTGGTVAITDSNTATITQSGKTLRIVFDIAGADCESNLMVMEQKPLIDLGFEQDQNTGSKLAVKVLGSGEISITAKMYMADEEAEMSAIDTTPIAQWTLR